MRRTNHVRPYIMMNRRTLLTTTLFTTASAAAAQAAHSALPPNGPLLPTRLKKGDRIGLIAPGSNAYEPEEIKIAQETMAQYGFEVILGKHVGDQYGYLAGKDRDRAADLNEMFARPDIKGIATFRGGYGCCRLLPYLNYDLIRANPKVLIGHSDITSLLIAIHQKTGLVTFHGPSGLTRVGDYAIEHIQRTIMTNKPAGSIAQPIVTPGEIDLEHRMITIVPGQATGRLIGGNLSLVTNLFGTPYEPDLRGKILFLEEVGEEPYRIDRMLTQLLLSGKLQTLAGIAFGHFTDCYPKEHLPTFMQTFSLENVLRDRCADLKIPILYNLMFGHLRQNATLPIGCLAKLDATGKTLTLLESAVV
jgi:muramoyltetrapeptide carboxypeptidase